MNIYNNQTLITLLLLFFVNLLGYIYSYLVVTSRIGKNSHIQNNERTDINYLKNHTPLFIINVLTLMVFVFLGFYFFKNLIINSNDLSFIMIIGQLFVVIIFDDAFFYILHRIMHENKFIYTKIHKIHHRANSPIPLDYIYVHPLEWMSGFIGPFIGILILGGVSIYTFWLYLFIRNFHEFAIHSGLKSSFINNTFPFAGTNEHHDIHHSKRDGNYASTFTFLDIIFKTKI